MLRGHTWEKRGPAKDQEDERRGDNNEQGIQREAREGQGPHSEKPD